MPRVEKIKEIMSQGNIILPLYWGKDHEKVSGAVYSGRMWVEYEGMTLYFDLWHHHNSEEDMTKEEVLQVLDLEGLKIGDKYHDIYWHARRVNGVFMFNSKGWFRDHELYKKVQEAETIEEFKALGLYEIPCLNW